MDDPRKSGWVLITQDTCKFCDKAKARLTLFDADFVAFPLTSPGFHHGGIPKGFITFQGLSTVPQIYHRGTWVGGYDKLEAYIESLGE